MAWIKSSMLWIPKILALSSCYHIFKKRKASSWPNQDFFHL
jgi:hypothetical protein